MSKMSIEAELAVGDAKVREIAKAAKTGIQLATPQEAPEAPETPAEAVVETEAPAEEEVVQEAAGEAEPEVPENEEQADKRFTLLAEREVKLRTLEKSVKEQEANLGKSVDQIRKEAYADLKRQVQEDPYGFFEAAGVSYEDVSKAMLQKRPDPTALKLKKELRELQTKLEQQERERKAAEQDRLRERARQGLYEYVEASEKHPLTRLAGMHDEVLNVITLHYNETGQVLSDEAAADRVEAYLTDLVERVNKGKAPKAAPTKPASTKPVSPTLKNKQSAAAPTRGNGPEELLSREESIERAAKMIRFINRE